MPIAFLSNAAKRVPDTLVVIPRHAALIGAVALIPVIRSRRAAGAGIGKGPVLDSHKISDETPKHGLGVHAITPAEIHELIGQVDYELAGALSHGVRRLNG
jgi:hypothetical protein